MGRGVRVACEACAYQFDLYEYVERPAATEDPESGANGWSGYLCPQCVAPAWIVAPAPPAAPASALEALLTPTVEDDRDAQDPMEALLSAVTGGEGAWARIAPRERDTAEAPNLAALAPRCANCDTPLLDFATATHELAEACRTRAGLDLRAEAAGRVTAEALLARAGGLREEVAAGERTTTDALAALGADLAAALARAASDPRDALAPLAATTALAQLGEALATAPDLTACETLLDQRMEQTRRHLGALQRCVEDEAALPGVPCPACGTGHLLHWPIWG